VNAETVSGHRSAKQNEGKRRPRDASPSLSASLRFVTDQDVVEQERGVTIDFATHFFRSRKNAKAFSLVDSPGHRDYIPAMILGACQASAAILVVDASTGEFESGFSEEGQTREHAILLRSLGIRCLVIIVNKMDMVAFAQDRFDIICSELASFLKTLGWRLGKDICFVPASGLSGLNLVDGPPANGHPLAKWYTGETVLGSLEALPTATAQEIQQAMNGPTRLIVSDMFRSSTLGGVFAICGRLVSGTVAAKDQLRLSPSAEVATVKSIEAGTTARQGANAYAVAGADSLPISLGLGNVSANIVASPGDVLCDPQSPVPTVSRFRGQIVTIATPVPVMQGLQVELHLGGRCEAAVISKLVELKMQTSAKVCTTKKRPRRLMNGDSAVIEVSVLRPICVELATDVKFLGRFALRSHGKTIAAGLVTALLQDKKESRPASVAADNT
jgi:elongation factor 1 alpha-like protein